MLFHATHVERLDKNNPRTLEMMKALLDGLAGYERSRFNVKKEKQETEALNELKQQGKVFLMDEPAKSKPLPRFNPACYDISTGPYVNEEGEERFALLITCHPQKEDGIAEMNFWDLTHALYRLQKDRIFPKTIATQAFEDQGKLLIDAATPVHLLLGLRMMSAKLPKLEDHMDPDSYKRVRELSEEARSMFR